MFPAVATSTMSQSLSFHSVIPHTTKASLPPGKRVEEIKALVNRDIKKEVKDMFETEDRNRGILPAWKVSLPVRRRCRICPRQSLTNINNLAFFSPLMDFFACIIFREFFHRKKNENLSTCKKGGGRQYQG